MIDAQAFTCVELKYHNCNKMGDFHIVMLGFVYMEAAIVVTLE